MIEQVNQCPYCDTSLTAKGFFCSNCAKPIRCKECKEALEKDANACIYCGTQITAKKDISTSNSSQPQMNQIEFHETRSTRSGRATFTDNVGASVSAALIGFIGKGFIPKQTPKFTKDTLIEEGAAEILNDSEEPNLSFISPEVSSLSINQTNPSELDLIKKIFRFEDNKAVLLETRLKASNKLDYARRLIILLLYGQQLLGHSNVPRQEVTRILGKANLNDGGTRQWIANNSWMHRDDKMKTLEINNPGEEEAKKYLHEIGNPEVKDGWLLNSGSKRKKKKKQDNSAEEQ